MVLQKKSAISKTKHNINLVLSSEAKRVDGIRISWNLKELKERIYSILAWICDGKVEINFRFCGLTEMMETNNYYRQKNYATDVLSFPSLDSSTNLEDPKHLVNLGDILICLPVCLKQAKQTRRQNHSLAQEVEKMIIHGVVHLKGFDHERSDSAWKVMTALERAVQKELLTLMGHPLFVIVGSAS